MHLQKVKVSINKTYKKLYARISNSFNPQKLPSCVFVVFIIDMNMYEGISKYSLKKVVQLLWLDSCYLFTKKMLNMELNMILHMEFA